MIIFIIKILLCDDLYGCENLYECNNYCFYIVPNCSDIELFKQYKTNQNFTNKHFYTNPRKDDGFTIIIISVSIIVSMMFYTILYMICNCKTKDTIITNAIVLNTRDSSETISNEL